MIEEVKKILNDCDNWERHIPVIGEAYWTEDPIDLKVDKVATQICQLFEPDEGRLLTIDEMDEAKTIKLSDDLVQCIEQMATIGLVDCEEDHAEYTRRVEETTKKCQRAKAQDAKTVSIKDAECQARVERILDGIENPHSMIVGNEPSCYTVLDLFNTYNEAIQTIRQVLKKKERVKYEEVSDNLC